LDIEQIEKRWGLGKPYVIISKTPDNDVIEAVGDIDQLVIAYRQYQYALGQIVNHLGPQILDCPEQHCEGCKMEAHEALRIAQEALSEQA
jgi:hypothetical protein